MRENALCPVLLGTDLGIYAMARSFHETYGVGSIVVSEQPRGPINDSAIVTNVFTGEDASEEDTLTTLEQIARQRPEQSRILIVNSDHQLAFVLKHRQRLSENFVIPFADEATINQLADKRTLNSVLADLQIPAPRTVEVSALPRHENLWRQACAELTLPIVMKPFAGAEFEELHFAGRRKVYQVESVDQLIAELHRIADAQYGGTMLLQELIPGDDTANRVVNCYRDSRGEITMAASGHVLLAMHQPTFIGNSAMIMVDFDEELVSRVTRVLEAVDFRGFASVDFKVDPRDGVAHLLDINPRLGRSHYYANVGGASTARSVVSDFVWDEALPVQQARTPGIYAYIPTAVLGRYVRDDKLRHRAQAVLRRRRAVHPLKYAADRNPKRWWYRILAQLNQLRALRTYYPRPTDTGF